MARKAKDPSNPQKAYGDPRRPESAGKAANVERVKIGKWLERWANVRLRGDFSAIEKKSAHNVLMLGTYLQKKLGPLGDLTDLGQSRHEKVMAKRREKRRAERASGSDSGPN